VQSQALPLRWRHVGHLLKDQFTVKKNEESAARGVDVVEIEMEAFKVQTQFEELSRDLRQRPD
jgi:hypothetical protein